MATEEIAALADRVGSAVDTLTATLRDAETDDDQVDEAIGELIEAGIGLLVGVLVRTVEAVERIADALDG